MEIKNYLEINNNKAYLRIKVTPKSPKTELFSVLDDNTLKIRLKAVPEKWKANKELLDFISKELAVKKDSIKILSWASDRTKLLRIDL